MKIRPLIVLVVLSGIAASPAIPAPAPGDASAPQAVLAQDDAPYSYTPKAYNPHRRQLAEITRDPDCVRPCAAAFQQCNNSNSGGPNSGNYDYECKETYKECVQACKPQ
jgi:hypothetical protein